MVMQILQDAIGLFAKLFNASRAQISPSWLSSTTLWFPSCAWEVVENVMSHLEATVCEDVHKS